MRELCKMNGCCISNFSEVARRSQPHRKQSPVLSAKFKIDRSSVRIKYFLHTEIGYGCNCYNIIISCAYVNSLQPLNDKDYSNLISDFFLFKNNIYKIKFLKNYIMLPNQGSIKDIIFSNINQLLLLNNFINFICNLKISKYIF